MTSRSKAFLPKCFPEVSSASIMVCGVLFLLPAEPQDPNLASIVGLPHSFLLPCMWCMVLLASPPPHCGGPMLAV